MHKIIDNDGNCFNQFEYTIESDFEDMVIDNCDSILGKDGIYFNIKKRIGKPKKGATIPDGYYLDLTFHTDPKLYLVEIELNSHDVYGHIGEQILRFGISSEIDKYKIKSLLLEDIQGDHEKQVKLNGYYSRSSFNNNSELLDRVIFDNKPAAIVIIDEATEELNNVMAQLTMTTEVLEVQTYTNGNKQLHRFTPFKDEVLSDVSENEDVDELDTIVVPAHEEGFIDEFINNNRWYAVRISASMIDKIKYIAAYQVAPVSSITHIAEVERIEKYLNTDKYMIIFKPDTTQKTNKIGLGKNKQGLRSARYSSYKAIMKAKSLDDLWGED